MYHFLRFQKGAVSLAAVLLIAVASIAVIALTYTATQTPTRITPQAQGGRCFWITAEFQKRADGLGYDPFVTFKSDDTSGFDDIYLTRDGALVAGPNKWTKANGAFVYYPQYTGGVVGTGQTISYTGRDDNCGARGNSSTISCTVDQNGNLIANENCIEKGGSGGSQPTSVPTQPPQTTSSTRLYIEPASVNTGNSVTITATGTTSCSTNITNFQNSPPQGLSTCTTSGGFSCSPNTKDGNACWWKWDCTTSQTAGSYTIVFNSNDNSDNCRSTANLTVQSPQIGQPQPTNPPPTHTPAPTAPQCGQEGIDCCNFPFPECNVGTGLVCSAGICIKPSPTPTPSNTPTPTPPPNATCGYPPYQCCTSSPIECQAGVCGNEGNCIFPTSTPTNTPTPTPLYANPTQKPQLASQVSSLAQNVVNRITGNTPTNEVPQQTIGETISGNVSVNNSLNIPIVETKVALYREKGEPSAIPADARNGTYEYANLPQQEYFIKAWVRDQNGNWYQNRPCTPTGDDYDCAVSPGDTQNLVVDIGPQGLRGFIVKTQLVSTSIAENLKNTIVSIPVIGSLLNTFFISAF